MNPIDRLPKKELFLAMKDQPGPLKQRQAQENLGKKGTKFPISWFEEAGVERGRG